MGREKPSKLFTISRDGTVTTNELLITVAQVANALGLKEATLRNKLSKESKYLFDPRLRVFRLGRNVRFRATDLIRVIQEPGGSRRKRTVY